jgi:hypothetical protein
MGNEQSKKPELPTQRRSTIRDTEFYRWLKEMRREINRPSSQPSSFGMPQTRTQPKRGGSSPSRLLRSGGDIDLFALATDNIKKEKKIAANQKELAESKERLMELENQLQRQNTELVLTKQQLENRAAKRNRSNAEEGEISKLEARVRELEEANQRIQATANTIINKIGNVELEASKRNMAKAMICEALMKIGGMFRWSTSPDKKDAKADEKSTPPDKADEKSTPPDKADEKSTAPNEKGAVKQSYMYELTYTYISLLVTMMVATAAHYDLDVKALASIGTASLTVTPFCMGLDKTIISFHRQRIIMVVLILVYVFLFTSAFTSATQKINMGLQFVLCKASGSYLPGCQVQTKPKDTDAQKQTEGTLALQDEDDGGDGDLVQYLGLLEQSLLGPDSDFVFSLLCTTVGTTDIFIKNLQQQQAFCSSLEKTVVSSLQQSWNNQVSRHIFSILTATKVREMLESKKVTKHNKSFGFGFNINIELGYTSKDVFVQTSDSDMATRFLWFLRHVNGKSLTANSSNRLQLHDGEPHSIATTILQMLFGDRDGQINREILLQDTVKSILKGQDVDLNKYYGVQGMQDIVEYMKRYPGSKQKLSDHTKATAIRLLKDK